MSKKIVMSLLLSAAMSVGGFFVSCGSGQQGGSKTNLIVNLPEGCTLLSPKDELGALTSGTPVVGVPPGKNRFEVECGGQPMSISKEIAAGQNVLNISQDDLH